MSKKQIVIAIFDDRYVASLELDFLKNAADDIQLETITEENYFNDYFNTAQKIDCLIIDENLYSEAVKRQGISNVFVLTDDTEYSDTDYYTNCISKFSSVKEILHKVYGKLGIKLGNGNKKSGSDSASAIMVYSPVGGVGTSTIAIALCHQLGMLNKKVLYLNMETVQNYQWIFQRDEYLDNGLERYMTRHDTGIVHKIKESVWHYEFDCIKPFRNSRLSYGLDDNDYIFAIQELLKAKIYDYIVIDTSSDFNMLNVKISDICNKVLTVLDQRIYSIYKVQQFLQCINYQDEEKFLFICNKLNDWEQNYLSQFAVNINLIEQIPYIYSEYGCLTLDDIIKNKIAKLAALILL